MEKLYIAYILLGGMESGTASIENHLEVKNLDTELL